MINKNKRELRKKNKVAKELNIEKIKGNSILTSFGKYILFYELESVNLMLLNDNQSIEEASKLSSVIKSVNKYCKLFIIDQNINLESNIDILEKIDNNTLTDKQINLKNETIDKLAETDGEMLSNKKIFLAVFDCEISENKHIFNKINKNINSQIPSEKEMYELYFQLLNSNNLAYNLELMNVNDILPTMLRYKPNNLVIGNSYRHIMKIRALPKIVRKKNLLSYILNEKNVNCSIAIEIIPPNKLSSMMNKKINYYKGILNDRRISNVEKARADTNLKMLQKSLDKSMLDDNEYIYFDIFIDVVDSNLENLKERVQSIKNKLLINNINFDSLNMQQQDGFKSYLPHNKTIMDKYSLNSTTMDFAKLNPLQNSSVISERGIILGREVNGSLIMPDIFDTTDGSTNSSILLLGKIGYGKSYMIKSIIAQELLKDRRIFVFDVENREYSALCDSVNGRKVSAFNNTIINPLQIRSFFYEESTGDVIQEVSIKLHLSWLESFFTFYNPDLEQNEIYALMQYLEKLYQPYAKVDITNLKNEDYPVFTELYNLFKDSKEDYSFSDSINETIELTIQSLAFGTNSSYFNGYTNFELKNDKLVLFELFKLEEFSRNIRDSILMNYLSFIWSYFTAEESQQIYKLFVLDELHLLVNKNNSFMSDQMKMMVKRGRKYKSGQIMSSQQSEDIEDFKALIANPSYKIIYNPGDAKILSELTGIEEHLIDIISTEKKRHALFFIENKAYRIKVESFNSLENMIGTVANSKVEL